jgi:hypothetical protein
MTEEIEKSGAALELDFSNKSQANLNDIDLNQLDQIVVHVPLPSFGSSNSHLDRCADLLDASWASEGLATCTQSIETTVASGYYKPNITAILRGLRPGLRAALIDCALLFSEDEDIEGRITDIRNRICKYEETLHEYTPRVPNIVDWYFANLMFGNYEWRSEAPKYHQDQMAKFPERQVGFFSKRPQHHTGQQLLCFKR